MVVTNLVREYGSAPSSLRRQMWAAAGRTPAMEPTRTSPHASSAPNHSLPAYHPPTIRLLGKPADATPVPARETELSARQLMVEHLTSIDHQGLAERVGGVLVV